MFDLLCSNFANKKHRINLIRANDGSQDLKKMCKNRKKNFPFLMFSFEGIAISMSTESSTCPEDSRVWDRNRRVREE